MTCISPGSYYFLLAMWFITAGISVVLLVLNRRLIALNDRLLGRRKHE